MNSTSLLLILGLACGAFAQKFDHDIKISVYDVFKSLQVGAPLNYFIDNINKSGEVNFSNVVFRYFPQNITEFVVAYKDAADNFFHGYYVRTGAVPEYSSEQFKKVKPLYDYIKSGEYYVLTPLAVQKALPEFFSTPLKDLHYDYFSDVDINKQIPLVFLIPKSSFKKESFENLILIADYEISQGGLQSITEYKGSRIARASPSTGEAYGEPEVSITKQGPAVLYRPDDFRLVTDYRYDLPYSPLVDFYSPYDYFFSKTFPSHEIFNSGFGEYYPESRSYYSQSPSYYPESRFFYPPSLPYYPQFFPSY